MARLPYVDPERASQPVREALQALPVPLKIFGMMAHAESSFRPLLRLGASILAGQQLDAKLRELAVLQAARLTPPSASTRRSGWCSTSAPTRSRAPGSRTSASPP
jgi:hypothetical protein